MIADPHMSPTLLAAVSFAVGAVATLLCCAVASAAMHRRDRSELARLRAERERWLALSALLDDMIREANELFTKL